LSEQAFGLATHRQLGSKMHEVRSIQQAIVAWVKVTAPTLPKRPTPTIAAPAPGRLRHSLARRHLHLRSATIIVVTSVGIGGR
jgi:hypothetical protein